MKKYSRFETHEDSDDEAVYTSPIPRPTAAFRAFKKLSLILLVALFCVSVFLRILIPFYIHPKLINTEVVYTGTINIDNGNIDLDHGTIYYQVSKPWDFAYIVNAGYLISYATESLLLYGGPIVSEQKNMDRAVKLVWSDKVPSKMQASFTNVKAGTFSDCIAKLKHDCLINDGSITANITFKLWDHTHASFSEAEQNDKDQWLNDNLLVDVVVRPMKLTCNVKEGGVLKSNVDLKTVEVVNEIVHEIEQVTKEVVNEVTEAFSEILNS